MRSAAVQNKTGDRVELTDVDQGYTRIDAELVADGWGIRLEVVKLPEAWKGSYSCHDAEWSSALTPGSPGFGVWPKDYEYLPESVAGVYLVAFSTLILTSVVKLLMGESL